jgi:hypothetical protein
VERTVEFGQQLLVQQRRLRSGRRRVRILIHQHKERLSGAFSRDQAQTTYVDQG